MIMEPEILDRVKKLSRKVNVVYVATADCDGVPHVAAAKGMEFLAEDRVFFRAWFCLETVRNLQDNPKVALALLDPGTNEGYQLSGEMERIEKGAILDGFAPGAEEKWRGYPQAEHQLHIRIKRISSFSSGAHSDEFLR